MEYSKIIKEKMGIEFEGLKRGEEFLEFFSQELNNLKLKNIGESQKLFVYNKQKKEFVCLEVSPEDFQHELQQCYKKFLREHFMKKYDWYKKFLSSISNTLESKFKVDSKDEEIFSYFHESVTTCFVVNSDIENLYDFNKIKNFLISMCEVTGFDEKQSVEIVEEIIQGFIIDELIFLNKNYIWGKKCFSISDPCMSVVFRTTAMFLPNVFARDEFTMKYSSEFNLENLHFCLENFLNDFKSFKLFKGMLYEYFPEMAIKMDDYDDIKSFSLDNFDPKQHKAILSIFFIKLLVNEFCFQTLVMSLFKSYYYTRGTKNVLFSLEKTDYKLYN
ncbi:MAG: hypothetical protein EOP33_07035 [Rickettsiaceae bacterium]|nr:MAG: hypothetical protein EOP33_07035 [Rickettsiaceae bacterium]